MKETLPVAVLGATGYVAGELLRLVHAHPHLELIAAVSESRAGTPIGEVFGHLAPAYPDGRFTAPEDLPRLLDVVPRMAAFSAAPHGASARLIDDLLGAAERADTELRLVDVSADFRFRSPEAYRAVYRHDHGAPHRLDEFVCALPEHHDAVPQAHVAHPGCFATAMLLAIVPLLDAGLVEPELYVSGITGSTGSGNKPIETTHHPVRHSNLYAYGALGHRHAPEVVAIAESATGVSAGLRFVPHSGPFARGIHVTVQARLARSADADEVRSVLAACYADAPFVTVVPGTPRLKDVVGSNYAMLGAAADGDTLAIFSVIDNLVKGAAGGAVQWMNRLLGLAETTGLTAPAQGWT
jgi:N-acetyl-gamma-glutamyl-phosphate reductase